jgi:hypothetical protein
MYSAMIGAVILARAVNGENFSREILAEARKTYPIASSIRLMLDKSSI